MVLPSQLFKGLVTSFSHEPEKGKELVSAEKTHAFFGDLPGSPIHGSSSNSKLCPPFPARLHADALTRVACRPRAMGARLPDVPAPKGQKPVRHLLLTQSPAGASIGFTERSARNLTTFSFEPGDSS